MRRMLGLTLRLADDPVYGRQLQRMAVPTLAAEASWRLLVSEGPPRLVVDRPASGRLTAPASARTAPDLRGLASLERVPDSVILARADPDDADGDGISVFVNGVEVPAGDYVYDAAANTVRFRAGAEPAPGASIEVHYTATCG